MAESTEDNENSKPFGLSLSKPFTISNSEEEPFDRLRANGLGIPAHLCVLCFLCASA